jgi:hypothetical protein
MRARESATMSRVRRDSALMHASHSVDLIKATAMAVGYSDGSDRVMRRVYTRLERRLCRRNAILGEASEGAVEAPSEFKTP